MTGFPDAPSGPGSALTLEEAVEGLEAARREVARVRDHNRILERQVMRLIEEDGGYRSALRGVGARLMDVGGRLAELGADLTGLGKYAIEQANHRVGVPEAARVGTAAAEPHGTRPSPNADAEGPAESLPPERGGADLGGTGLEER